MAIPLRILEDIEQDFEEQAQLNETQMRTLHKLIIDDVLEKFSAIQSECEAWHDYVERCRKLYLLWHHDDDEMYNVTISKPHNIVTFAKGVLTEAEYHPQAVAFRETEDTIDRMNALEKFTLALWDTNEERQPWPPRDQFINNLLVDGSGWMQVYLDPDYAPPIPIIPEWPQNPITLEVVDTLQVYPCLSQNPRRPFDYVITRHEETLFDLMQQWPDADWDEHKPIMGTEEMSLREVMIEVYNYTGYDDRGNVVQTICTNRLVLADEVLWHSSQYPYLPWVVASCYTGLPPQTNMKSEVPLISRFQSILHPVDDDVQTLEQILSADLRAVDKYGNLPPVIKTQAGRPVTIDPEWGNIIELQLGEEFTWAQWPGNPPDSTRLTNFLLGDMAEGSFSAAAMGYPGSSASGYHVALTMESSRTRLYLPGRSFARAIKQTADLAVHLLSSFMPMTTIHMYGLGPDGQMGAFGFHPLMAQGLHLDCRIKLTMPGDDVRQTAIAGQQLAFGMPFRTVLEDVLDYQQPDDIIRNVMTEKAEQHPLIMLLGMAKALEEKRSPYLNIILQALGEVAQGMVSQTAGAIPSQSAPGMRPPGQQPNQQEFGQNIIPDELQGRTPIPGQAPPNVPMV